MTSIHISNNVNIKNIFISAETRTDDTYTWSPATYSETIPTNLSLTCPNNISDLFESYDVYHIYKEARDKSTFIYDKYVRNE